MNQINPCEFSLTDIEDEDELTTRLVRAIFNSSNNEIWNCVIIIIRINSDHNNFFFLIKKV